MPMSPTAMVRADEGGGPFDLINGIPVHPLVVHAAVVLVPLAALGVLAMAVLPRFSKSLGWLVAAVAAVAAAASWVAKEAGEALEERVGAPGFDHAELGEVMPVLSAGLFVVAAALWLVDRSAPEEVEAGRRAIRIGVAVLGALVAVANVVWVYRVGDSGARSVWTGRVAASVAAGSGGEGGDPASGGTATASEADTTSEGAGGSSAGGSSADDSSADDSSAGDRLADDSSAEDGEAGAIPRYTRAEVAERATADDCWAAVGGSVYDLTEWVDEHPGGADRIIDLCGTDGTAAFDGQHAGEGEPAEELAEYVIGVLG